MFSSYLSLPWNGEGVIGEQNCPVVGPVLVPTGDGKFADHISCVLWSTH